jgi:hypothetical protein
MARGHEGGEEEEEEDKGGREQEEGVCGKRSGAVPQSEFLFLLLLPRAHSLTTRGHQTRKNVT